MVVQRKKKKKKKPVKQKKVTFKLTRKQMDLLYLYSKYSGESKSKIVSKALKIYLKQVSHDFEHLKKITSVRQLSSDAEHLRQMEINF